ncbi:E1 ubiquitin-activating protein uba2 [Nowakowskiella sp. JEL0407]|nr:E1 ubiquitin-activating protein uba2 [Nowakowskiella sp. JEL0407]
MANITTYYTSIFAPEFSVSWFQSFSIVLNALDNLSARRHVNLMCVAAKVPLIESGTQGYEGQVTVHIPGKFMCFDCEPHATPKTFPVCTIRSTPSAPIHCIVWAKSYLLNQLFGQDEEQVLTEKTDDQNTLEELEKLKNEANALKKIKELKGDEFLFAVFEKVFEADIKRLASTDALWKVHDPPTPILLSELKVQLNTNNSAEPSKKKRKGSNSQATTTQNGSTGNGLSRDHLTWTKEDSMKIFVESLKKLKDRYESGGEGNTIEFEKDDDEIMDFVAATANLRAECFGIEVLSRFKIKEMAGSIIPAIATTNAVIAGMIVVQALKVLLDQQDALKNTYYTSHGNKSIQGYYPHEPNDKCAICQSKYISLKVDKEKCTVEEMIKLVGIEGDVEVMNEGRLIYDCEYTENGEKKLSEVITGDRVMMSDEDSQNYVILLS